MARMFAYIAFVVAIAAILNAMVSTLEARGTAAADDRRHRTAAIAGAALRRRLTARIGVIALLFVLWEIAARWFVDPMFLSPPSRVLDVAATRCSTHAACRRRCASPCSSSPSPSRSRSRSGWWSGSRSGCSRSRARASCRSSCCSTARRRSPSCRCSSCISASGRPPRSPSASPTACFPIIVTVVAGVQNIKPILLTSARSMGASRWQILRHVIFPHMIPSFFAGMRLGMTGVLLGVLLAELYVSTAGIGYFTTLFTQNFDPTKLLGLIGDPRRHGDRAQRDRAAGRGPLRPLAHGLREEDAMSGKLQIDRRVRRLRDRARAQGRRRRGRRPRPRHADRHGPARAPLAHGAQARVRRLRGQCRRLFHGARPRRGRSPQSRCSCIAASATASCSSTPPPASASRRT